jgi:predicted Zn-dependent protease
MSKLFRILLAGAAIAAGVLFAASGDAKPESGSGTPEPHSAGDRPPVAEPSRAVLPCPDGGYLCANVEQVAEIRVRRWTDAPTTLVVHVPVPDFEPPAEAARLQSEAAAGIRAWNGHPFPVRVEQKSAERAHFSVRWVPTLPGEAVGVARTTWSSRGGLGVTSIDLATRSPHAPDILVAPDHIRLTAAHEMGHALGLPHSDSTRDVMYPKNTAAALTARDYRSMEALYGLPDGAVLAP